jgi:FkbM family methyltransferase
MLLRGTLTYGASRLPCDAAMSLVKQFARHVPGASRLKARLRGGGTGSLEERLASKRLLRAFAVAFPSATFVEIGANDGEQLDHLRTLIYERGWRGVMVEPVPYVFKRLRQNYAETEHVAFENAAIADRDGSLSFFHLAQVDDPEREGLPPWYDAIGSFSRKHVIAHKIAIPDIEKRVVETTVPCITFDSLCVKHGLDGVDLLVIDTEGYDYEILRHIDFSRHRPVVIGYEHRHLGPTDRANCRQLLHHAGYETKEEGHETWCLRPDASGRLTRKWRRLRPAVPPVAAYEEPWWQE